MSFRYLRGRHPMNGSSPRFRPFFPNRYASLLAGLLIGLAGLPASAGVPADLASKATVIGQPAALVVQPESITLTGRHAFQQLVVTGRYADGRVRDLTALCEWSSETPA